MMSDESMKKAAGILGITESVLIIALTIFWLNLYLIKTNMPGSSGSHDSFSMWQCIHIFFFHADPKLGGEIYQLFSPEHTLKPIVFHVFTWLNLLFHVTWLVASSFLVFTNGRTQNKKPVSTWLIITFTILVWDFITSALLISDHVNCLKFNKEIMPPKIKKETCCNKAMLPMIAVAWKFIVLWITNGLFVLKLFKLIYNKPLCK